MSNPPVQTAGSTDSHNPSADANAERLSSPTRNLRPTSLEQIVPERAVEISTPPLPDIPGFHVIQVLGRGGMGIVYQAMQIRLNRLVAIKMLLHRDHGESDLRDRFEQEAETIAAVKHPNIVQIFDFGEHQGQPYLVMEFIDGDRLDQMLIQSPPTTQQTVNWMETISRAVGYAHQAGIVHRDLKPANILLDGHQQPKVSDFGLAKHLDSDFNRTLSGMIVGTPQYMSPEQATGERERLSPASDVFALGIMLYEMLTGLLPHRGATITEQMDHLIHIEPIAPQTLRPSIPQDLDTICMHCLAKEPRHRYADATELANELWRFRIGEPILARRPRTSEYVWRWIKKHRSMTAILGVITFAVMGLIGLGFWFSLRIGEARGDLELAEVKSKQADELAATQRVYRLITESRDRQLTRPMGWAIGLNRDWDAALKAGLPPTVPLAEVRTELLASLSAIDFVEERRIPVDGLVSWTRFHPTHPWLIISTDNTEINSHGKLWIIDYLTGQLVTNLLFPFDFKQQLRDRIPERVQGMVISPDGRWLVIRCPSQMMHRWDLTRPHQSHVSWAHNGPPLQIAFAEDSTAFYSIGSNHILTRWDTDTWTPTDSKRSETRKWFHLEPRGQQIRVVQAQGLEHQWEMIDAKTLELTAGSTRLTTTGMVNFLLGNGDRAIGFTNGRLHLSRPNLPSDAGSIQELRPPFSAEAHDSVIVHLALAPNQTTATSVALFGERRVWDLVTRNLAADISMPGFDNTPWVQWDTSGTRLAVNSGKTVRLLQRVDSGLVTSIPVSGGVIGVTWRPDSTLGLMTLLPGTNQHQLRFFRPEMVADRLQVPTLPMEQWPGWSAEGTDQAAPPIHHSTIAGWSGIYPHSTWRPGETGEQLGWETKQEKSLARIAHAYDSRGRHWACRNDVLTISRPETQAILGEYRHQSPDGGIASRSIHAIAIHQDVVIIGGQDGRLKRIHFDSFQPSDLGHVPNPIESIHFSPDGRFVAVGTQHGNLVLLDPQTGQQQANVPNAHRGALTALAWIDDRYLITGSSDRLLHGWQVQPDGGLAHDFSIRVSQAIRQLSVSPDRRWLVPVVRDELGFRVWDLDKLRKAFQDRGLWPSKD